jgi:hypothetical protein
VTAIYILGVQRYITSLSSKFYSTALSAPRVVTTSSILNDIQQCFLSFFQFLDPLPQHVILSLKIDTLFRKRRLFRGQVNSLSPAKAVLISAEG